MEFITRAFKTVNLQEFGTVSTPDLAFTYDLNCPHKRQYVLRMCIREPHKEFTIPDELLWVKDLVLQANQVQLSAGIKHAYCYITIRHGEHTAVTEDIWHTDGYSEVLTHIPEQNYIVTSNDCTEFVTLPIIFPRDFNTSKHDVVEYIDKVVTASDTTIQQALPNEVRVFDPYVIHRRPPGAFGKERTFVRVTFVPIEICDDACTPNPLLAPKFYNRSADTTRCTLQQYRS